MEDRKDVCFKTGSALIGELVACHMAERETRLASPVAEGVVGEETPGQGGNRAVVDPHRGDVEPGCLERDDPAAREHVEDHWPPFRELRCDQTPQPIERSCVPIGNGPVDQGPV